MVFQTQSILCDLLLCSVCCNVDDRIHNRSSLEGCDRCSASTRARGPLDAPRSTCGKNSPRSTILPACGLKRELESAGEVMTRATKKRRLSIKVDNEDTSMRNDVSTCIIPDGLLATLISPFLADRETYDNFSMISREVYDVCKSLPAPWPRQILKVNSVVQSVAFSQSGRLLACSSKNAIRIWDRQDGSCQCIETPSKITCVAFSPDEKYLATGHRSAMNADGDFCLNKENSNDNLGFVVVCLWDLSSDFKCCRVLRGEQSGGVLSIAFSPDGKTIASGGMDQCVRLWNVADSTCMATLRGHSNWIYDVKFSPDGKFLASVGEDETAVWLWNLVDYSYTNLEGHTECVHSIVFTPDGKYLFSGSDDETIRVWNITNNFSSVVLEGNQCSVWALACSPDSKTFVSGSKEADGSRVLRIWSIGNDDSGDARPISMLRGHTDYITSVAFSPSGRALASGSFDGSVRIWNMATDPNPDL